ncbi:MAG: response regulator, partial [Verrucomicrobia bacterium]|nr:response regulator [Verrucomicrobiota bacterium]
QSQVGEGSTFTLHLPALSTLSPPHAPPATAPAAAAPPMSHAPAATQVVLAIDDDPAVHAFLRDALASENWRLAFAASGTEGLRLARELKPDVITLDVLMPEMDGWVVLSLLKTDPQLAPIPVIMLTVKEQQDFAFAMGVADYLQKPIDRDRLVAVLRKHRRLDPPVQVLVVEDDPHMRDMLRRMLERDDWRVAEAENGLVALEQISRSLPSLIVLDLMMPVMDGFQMVAELQKHETWRRIPIVIVSAKELTPDDRRRLQGHVRAILQKGSFRRSDLMREIQHTVRVFLASPPPSTEGGPPPAAPPAQRRANLEP